MPFKEGLDKLHSNLYELSLEFSNVHDFLFSLGDEDFNIRYKEINSKIKSSKAIYNQSLIYIKDDLKDAIKVLFDNTSQVIKLWKEKRGNWIRLPHYHNMFPEDQLKFNANEEKLANDFNDSINLISVNLEKIRVEMQKHIIVT